MCRLIAIIDPKDKKIIDSTLREFGSLAKTGTVPPGTDAGHKDGWGLAAYKNSAMIFLEKNPLDASSDQTYQTTIDKICEINPSLILGHLRKASRGEISMENTQPYAFGQYTFCHNGTVRDFKKIILEPAYLSQRKGTTDSEVVFLYLLQTIKKNGDFLKGFLEGIKKLRSMDYTGLNILMSDGKTLLALRSANEKDAIVKDNALCDSYYTLLQGKNQEEVPLFICSQSLDIAGITWTTIPNHAVLVLDIGTQKEDLIVV